MLKLQNFVNSDIFTIQVQHIHMIPISELSVVWMGVDGCKRTYRNYASFRRHLKKKHSEILDSQLQQEFITVGEEEVITMKAWKDPQSGVILLGLKLCMTHQRALFILKSREVHKISQGSLSDDGRYS